MGLGKAAKVGSRGTGEAEELCGSSVAATFESGLFFLYVNGTENAYFLSAQSIAKLYCGSSWDCVLWLVFRTECVIPTLNVRCARWVLQTDNGYSRH
jgi:hypothetical protein